MNSSLRKVVRANRLKAEGKCYCGAESSRFPDGDETKEFESLLRAYGDSMFSCGEFPDDGSIDAYEELAKKAEDTRLAVVNSFKGQRAK